MIKIGIDARLLSRPITGVGRYTLEMCRALSKQPNITLYLYSPAAILADFLIGLESVNIKMGNSNNGLVRQIWSESFLPIWANNDGVDVFWGPAHRIPRFLPSKIARVVTIHDLVWKYAADTMRPLSRLLEKNQMPFAVNNADHVAADTQATANAVLNEFDIGIDKLTVVTPGVNAVSDVPSMEALHTKGITQPYFLFVGTLEPRKNLSNLLEAYASLPESVKVQVMFVVAGGVGWGGVNLHETVTHLGLDKHVKLLGYVDEPTLATLYANARFLAMPSLYEGFGFPLVEAMAYGTPVLTANNSSMPEVAGNAGLLVDALDVGSIANGLKQLICMNEIQNALSSKAKSNAARFNWDDSAKALVAIFEKAISDRRALLS